MSTCTRKVPPSELHFDPRCQSRIAIDSDAVAEYQAAYEAKAEMPPPEVFSVDGALYVVDGYHRVAAAIGAGVSFLRVTIVGEGTMDQAVWRATSANRGHGLRRTNADKRRAVRMALESPIGQEQSSRVIADHCGVSANFVAQVRHELEGQLSSDDSCGDDPTANVRSSQLSSDDSSEPVRRRGKDGKLRRLPEPRAQRSICTDESLPQLETSSCVGVPSGSSTADPSSAAYVADGMPDYGAALEELSARVRTVRIGIRRDMPAVLVGLRQRVEQLLLDTEHAIELAAPVPCPKCGGPGCTSCGSRGWTTRLEAGR